MTPTLAKPSLFLSSQGRHKQEQEQVWCSYRDSDVAAPLPCVRDDPSLGDRDLDDFLGLHRGAVVGGHLPAGHLSPLPVPHQLVDGPGHVSGKKIQKFMKMIHFVSTTVKMDAWNGKYKKRKPNQNFATKCPHEIGTCPNTFFGRGLTGFVNLRWVVKSFMLSIRRRDEVRWHGLSSLGIQVNMSLLTTYLRCTEPVSPPPKSWFGHDLTLPIPQNLSMVNLYELGLP